MNFKNYFLQLLIISFLRKYRCNISIFYSKDLFGFISPFEYKNTGPFIDEAIAGGFIQRFSLFIFCLYNFSIKKLNLKIYTLSLLFILVISIIFSGNRMPLILFILSIILIILIT